LTALNFDDFHWLTQAINEKAMQQFKAGLTEQPNDRSPDEIKKEVKNQIDDWSNRIEEAHKLLGGHKKADQYLAKIEKDIYVEHYHNLTPSPKPTESRDILKQISLNSGKLASLLDTLHSDDEFNLAIAIDSIISERLAETNRQNENIDDLREQLHRAKRDNDQDAIETLIGQIKAADGSQLPDEISRLNAQELSEILRLYQTGAERVCVPDRPKGIDQVDFSDDLIRSYLSIPEGTKTFAFSPRVSFILGLVKIYHSVFGHKPAYKRTSKFIRALEVFVDLAGFPSSGLETVVNDMNLWLEKSEGPRRLININPGASIKW